MVYLALNIDGTASHEGNMDLGFVIQNTIISLFGFPLVFANVSFTETNNSV